MWKPISKLLFVVKGTCFYFFPGLPMSICKMFLNRMLTLFACLYLEAKGGYYIFFPYCFMNSNFEKFLKGVRIRVSEHIFK